MTGRRVVRSGIAGDAGVVLGASFLAILVGWAAAGLHLKIIYILLVPLALALLMRAGTRGRFAVLMFAVVTIPLQSPSLLPLGMSFGLVLVVALVVAQWSCRAIRTSVSLTVGIPLVLFSGLGMVAMYAHGDLARVSAVSLTPVVWFLAAGAFVREAREALRIQAACAIAGLAYLLIVIASGVGGWSTTSRAAVAGDPGYTGMSRLGAQGWTLPGGLFAMQFYPTWLATLLALALPAACLLFFRAKSLGGRLWWAVAVAFLAYGLLLTAGRAGTIGALVGITVALVASGRFTTRGVLAWSAAAVVSALAFGTLIAGVLSSVAPSANVARLVVALSSSGDRTGNLAARLDVLRRTYAIAERTPLGRGFAYWYLRGVDDPIVFVWLLNGVGLLASLCLAALLVALLTSFARRARGSVSDERDSVAIALGVLVSGLLAGVGSHSVLIEPVQSFMFWGFAMAAYWGAHPREPIRRPGVPQVSAGNLLPQGVGERVTAPVGRPGSGAVREA